MAGRRQQESRPVEAATKGLVPEWVLVRQLALSKRGSAAYVLSSERGTKVGVAVGYSRRNLAVTAEGPCGKAKATWSWLAVYSWSTSSARDDAFLNFEFVGRPKIEGKYEDGDAFVDAASKAFSVQIKHDPNQLITPQWQTVLQCDARVSARKGMAYALFYEHGVARSHRISTPKERNTAAENIFNYFGSNPRPNLCCANPRREQNETAKRRRKRETTTTTTR